MAIKFDLYQNPGDPSNDSTGIFEDGAEPVGGIDLTGSGINLHSGDNMDAHITYDGTTLTLTITDLMTLATLSHPFVVNIPAAVGGNTAYIGFTGSTGGQTSVQQILNWSYQPGQASALRPDGHSFCDRPDVERQRVAFRDDASIDQRRIERGRQRLLHLPGRYHIVQYQLQVQVNQPSRRWLHVYDSESRPNRAGRQWRLPRLRFLGTSVAIKFDLFQNPGDPSNDSTGIFVDGGPADWAGST